MKLRDGGPAFPASETESSGMSLRDYFAAQALTGFVEFRMLMAVGDRTPRDIKKIARLAYNCADALLEARDDK